MMAQDIAVNASGAPVEVLSKAPANAYWCAYCARASKDKKRGIKKFYQHGLKLKKDIEKSTKKKKIVTSSVAPTPQHEGTTESGDADDIPEPPQTLETRTATDAGTATDAEEVCIKLCKHRIYS